ncbi:Glutaredoxin-C11 protein [Spatholobus suberectus]|nr:Glutaredoxin-C11 protein [Spatholobus suberectus]
MHIGLSALATVFVFHESDAGTKVETNWINTYLHISLATQHHSEFRTKYNILHKRKLRELLEVMDRVRDLSSKKAAVIFTKSSCYMCHSITQLFYELGASPAVHELDKDAYGREMEVGLKEHGV